MLPKQYRTPTASFDNKNADLLKSDSFSIKLIPNSLSHPRVGIIVSKKISPKAVKRNNIKRRLLSVISTWVKSSNSPIDLVVLTKKKITSKTQAQLGSEFSSLKLKLDEKNRQSTN